MKNKLYIFALGLLLIPSYSYANTAPTKKDSILKPKITCDEVEFSTSQWGAICNNGNESIQINGSATCSDFESDGLYSKYKSITTDEEEDLIYCYCQITSPFKSQYVYTYEYMDTTECENWCPQFCANAAKNNDSFREALFSGISEN